jgi:hypothetical protein
MPWKDRALLLSTLLILLLTLPLLHHPHKTSLQLNGSSTLTVPANRATISLQISSEGTKQRKVADEVRQTTDKILTLLRPLTLPPNRTSTTSSTGPNTPSTEILPPIATLSVNTFSSHSYPRTSLLGETTTYSSTITITAEFRSLSDLNPSPDRTVIPSFGFHHLSLVLPSLTKLHGTKINYLKWFLSPERLASLQSEARQNAMSEALTKISDYIAPMQLQFPVVRCLSFREEKKYKSHEHVRSDFDSVLRRQADDVLMSFEMGEHDELDGGGYGYGYEIEQQKAEAFGLEPQSIEIASQVEGDWVIVEQGLIRTLLGLLS